MASRKPRLTTAAELSRSTPASASASASAFLVAACSTTREKKPNSAAPGSPARRNESASSAIVAEFDYHGRVTTTRRTFTASNIFVLRVRDGRIVSSRDYHNHHVLADAFAGTADERGVASA